VNLPRQTKKSEEAKDSALLSSAFSTCATYAHVSLLLIT